MGKAFPPLTRVKRKQKLMLLKSRVLSITDIFHSGYHEAFWRGNIYSQAEINCKSRFFPSPLSGTGILEHEEYSPEAHIPLLGSE